MKENIFRYSISIVFLMIAVSLYPATDKKLTSYVNPFIGTGAVASSLSGNNFPGATVPFWDSTIEF